MSPPRVSYVVASYNHEQYVEAFLHSVLTQSYDDLEVIVVDDGSSDRTLDLARKIASGDRRLHVHWQENQGALHARSRGIALSRGDYVSIVDSDDLMPPERTRWMVEALDRNARAVLVYGDAWLIDKAGLPLRRFFDTNPPRAGDFSVELFCHYCFVPGTSVMVRRAALLESGPFWGPVAHADYLKWIELGLCGDVICLRDKPLSCWRLHGANMSDTPLANRAATYQDLRESLQLVAERQPDLARRIGVKRLASTYARCHFSGAFYAGLGQSWGQARAHFASAYHFAPTVVNAAGWISALPLVNLVSRHGYRAVVRARRARRHSQAAAWAMQ